MAETRTFGPSALATPANALTLLRLLLAPLLMVWIAARGDGWGIAAAWVALAGSDGLDGWIARRQGTTRSGAFLDPLADKLLVLGALAALAARHVLPWLPVGLIAAREVGVSVYRSYAGRRGRSLPARPLAELKTLAQDVTVTVALIPGVVAFHHGVVLVLVWAAVALTLASGLGYALRPAA